jgi:NADH-quinone oxidoreductase subunit J
VTVAEAIFYIFAVLVVVSALGVVTVPNVVHAALFLVLALLGVAAFYILLGSEFLFLVQVLIYAGAIAVIVLFGLMLTRGREQDMPSVGAGAQWPLAMVGSGVLLIVLLTAVLDVSWPRDVGEVTLVNIETLGGALFRDWLLPLIVVAFVLDVALTGAIVIAHPDREED